ncbi:MAG TPA: SCO1664 family protein [Nocardioidaceae bacterium]|nr:SCO1664 family protein [Nocardioidaceae bacterium]
MTSPTAAPLDESVVLGEGDLELTGRIVTASNATFYGTTTLAGSSVECVYKPVVGERPLWDFPDGTLARREVAAYAVSEALGWGVVPPTLLRDGPAGPGMVQAWREPDPGQSPVDVRAAGRLPDGYLHVLDAVDGADRPVVLVHEDSAELRRMAVFDILVNNADRKGGHVLAMPDGHRHGVDHGVCFHVDHKLRTVLWGWSGRTLDPHDVTALQALLARLSDPAGELPQVLGALLEPDEVDALRNRGAGLVAAGRMPAPSMHRPMIPWPPF